MKRNKIYIEKLIHAFFDGTTSNTEEKELYQYFSGEDIDSELEKYKDLFSFFDEDLADEFAEIEQKEDADTVEISAKDNRKLKRLAVMLVSAAAVILLVILFNPFTQKTTFNPYEGSYARIDGKMYSGDDMSILEKLEKEILEKADREEESVDEILNAATEQENRYKTMINSINEKTKEYEELIQDAD